MFSKGSSTTSLDPVLAPLSRAAAERLVRLAQAAAATRGLRVRYDGAGALITADGAVAGLTNLARSVAGQPSQHWQELVEDHFDRLVRWVGHPPLPPANPLGEVYLRLVTAQNIPADWCDQLPQFLPGVHMMAATQVDGAIALHLEPDRLGMSKSEVLTAGLANLRRLTDTVEYLMFDDAVVAQIGDSPFAASRALVLDTVLRETLFTENPSYGVLASIPTRDRLLLHVIRDESLVAALALMSTLAVDAYTNHPGPISPHVYFVHDNDWERLTDTDGTTLRPDLSPQVLQTIHPLLE
ncbi:hypothetical protein [Kribbella deserti]|uniref:Uncharacterized protein n=1 Tax=Kribbella deserti TaxID=1926257 RepID=A0ABV6QX06_9ACTN